MKIEMPKACADILQRFHENGYEAYLVGGCVRDTLLGKKPLDWDICTEALPKETIKLFQEDKVILTGLKHGTVTILKHKLPVEVTTYRIDGEYLDNRRPKEVFFTKNLIEDLSRRDFTINAMAYNDQTGLIDYFGGLDDLHNGLIRAVGDASQRYHEDGLRLMRAVRFACVLNFDYDIATKQAIKDCCYLLQNIAVERIQIELNKILCSPYVEKGLHDLYHLGCFYYFLPEICHTYGFEQHNPFHCYDVFEHAIKSTSFIPCELTLRLTMLLHDIAKPFTWQNCYGESDCFPQHELLGAQMAEKILNRLHYDKATIKEVVKLIRHHNDHLKPESANVRQHAAALGVDSLKRLLAVKRADLKAQSAKASAYLNLFDEIEKLLDATVTNGDCLSLKDLAVNGQDLLKIGYQGAAVGQQLSLLLALVLQDPALNDRETLLAFCR